MRLLANTEEAEQHILGSILWNPELLNQAANTLKPDNFRYEKHKCIFGAMLLLSSQGVPINELTLWDILKERGELDTAGGTSYITYLPLVTINDN